MQLALAVNIVIQFGNILLLSSYFAAGLLISLVSHAMVVETISTPIDEWVYSRRVRPLISRQLDYLLSIYSLSHVPHECFKASDHFPLGSYSIPVVVQLHQVSPTKRCKHHSSSVQQCDTPLFVTGF